MVGAHLLRTTSSQQNSLVPRVCVLFNLVSYLTTQTLSFGKQSFGFQTIQKLKIRRPSSRSIILKSNRDLIELQAVQLSQDYIFYAYIVNFFLIYKGFKYLFPTRKSLNHLVLADLVGNIILFLLQNLSNLKLDGLVGGVVSTQQSLSHPKCGVLVGSVVFAWGNSKSSRV